MPETRDSSLRFGAFVLDLRVRRLWRGPEPVQLPSRAVDVLAYLIAHRDRAVEKDEIIAAVWHDVAVTDDSLTHAVSVLRRALRDDPAHPSFIETVPRRGYRFVAAVEAAADGGASDGGTAAALTPLQSGVTGWLIGAPVFRTRQPTVAVGVILIGAALLAAVGYLVGDRARPETIRVQQTAPDGTTIVSAGIVSPTGRHLAFVARNEQSGATALWVRSLATTEPYVLPGTTGASKPFWSPDGRMLAFFAQGKLLATTLTGGSTRVIAEVGGAQAGGSWGSQGQVLFADYTSGLYAVPAEGGPIRPVTRIHDDAVDVWHGWPQFLPDGRQFLYQVVAIDGSRAGVFAGNLESPRSVRLIDASAATFVPPGHLLYVRNDTLMAEALDVNRLTLSGRPVLLAQGLSAPSLAEGNVVSGAHDLVTFRERTGDQQLMRVDRFGTEGGSIIQSPVPLSNVRLSPDGRSLLATGSLTGASGVWLLDLIRQQHTWLSPDGLGSVWSPDGRRVAYTTRGGRDVVLRGSTSDDAARVVVSDPFVKIANDWSPDGRQIVYAQLASDTKLDLWGVSPAGGRPVPVLRTPFNEAQARISPDGRWIAYVSDVSGSTEVWVRRYPEMDEPVKVSAGGGGQPQWRPDQSELFFLSPDRALMAVDVSRPRRLSFGPPRRLFATSIVGGASDARDSYAVMPDGRTFVVSGARQPKAPESITLIQNWAAGLTPVAVVRPGLSRTGEAFARR